MRNWLLLGSVLFLGACSLTPGRADEGADWKDYFQLKKAVAAIPREEGEKKAALYSGFFTAHPGTGPWVGAKLCAEAADLHYAAKDVKTAEEVCAWAEQRWPKHPALVEVLSARAGILLAENRASEVGPLFEQNWDLLARCRSGPVVSAADRWRQALEKQGKKGEAAALLQRILLGCPILADEALQWNQGFLYDRLHERLIDAGETETALRFAKLRFLLCRFDTAAMERSTKMLASAFMAKDPSRKLGRAFVEAQSDSAKPNPLADVKLPEVDREALKAQIARTQGDHVFHDRITLLLLAGDHLSALLDARRYMVREPDKPDGANEICRILKAVDGSVRRSNAFAEFMKTGEGENPLDAFSKELQEKAGGAALAPPPSGVFPGGPGAASARGRAPLSPAQELAGLLRLPLRGVAPTPVSPTRLAAAALGAGGSGLGAQGSGAAAASSPPHPLTPSPVHPLAAGAPAASAIPAGALAAMFVTGPGAAGPAAIGLPEAAAALVPAPAPVSARALTLRFTVGDIAKGVIGAEEAWRSGAITAEDAVATLQRTPLWQDESACVRLAGLLAEHAPERLAEAGKWNEVARWRLAQYYRGKRDARCVPLYESVLADVRQPRPGLVPALIDLGLFYAQTGEHQRALDTFLQAERYSTNKTFQADCSVEAGRCCAALGDLRRAEELYARVPAAGNDRYSALALLDQGELCAKRGDYDGACRVLQRYPVKGPMAVAVWALLGYCYYRSGDLANARRFCEQAAATFKTLENPENGAELAGRAQSAERCLRWVAFWEKTPLLCDPAELAIRVAPGGAATCELSVRTYRKVALTVAPAPASLQARVEEAWRSERPYYYEKKVSVTIPPEAVAGGGEMALALASPELPGATARVPIRAGAKP